MIDMIFAGIGTASSAIQTLGSVSKSFRGLERSLILEIKQNIQLLEEFFNKELDAAKIIGELETDNFIKINESNFNYKKLQRKNITEKSIGQVKSLRRYINWDTEKLIINIFLKIIHLQKLSRIGYEPERINIKLRLKNILLLMLLLSRHLGS